MKRVISRLALAAFIIGAACGCTHHGEEDLRNANPSIMGVRPRAKECVTGRVGEGFYENHFPAETGLDESSNEYLVEYTVTNTAQNDLVFDRMEQHWSAGGKPALSVSTTQPEEPRLWRLPPGGTQTFVAETKNDTSRLYDDAKGGPVDFSITLFYEGKALLGPFYAELPRWETLQRVDHQDALLLEAMGATLPEEGKALAAQQRQKMTPLKFWQK